MKTMLQNKSRVIAAVILLGFAVCLIPILHASFYAHPANDDYGYSAGVRQAVSSGAGIASVLQAVFKTVAHRYQTWQGTFSAICIFSLQPGVFSDDLYFLTTFIMLAALIGPSVFLMDTVASKWLGMRRSHGIILTFTVLFLQIQFVPDIAEAFFWFNGSSYYTLFYGFELVLLALFIRLLLASKAASRTRLTICCILLAFIIGGGNYSTGLGTLCLLGLVFLLLLIKKDPDARNLLAILAALLIAFLISMAAPGNGVRASQLEQMGPIQAVWTSFLRAAELVGRWTRLCELVAFVFLSPLIYLAAGKASWSFRYPLLVLALSFGCFACQMTPPLYAMSNIGSGRQVNIYYYFYILMILFDLFYVSGWIQRKYPSAVSLEAIRKMPWKQTICVICLLAILFAFGCISYGIDEITAAACYLALKDGTAQEYDRIVEENIAKLEATTGDCYIQNMENPPPIFKKLEISEDNTFWINQHYASYFGCASVNLEKNPDEASKAVDFRSESLAD